MKSSKKVMKFTAFLAALTLTAGMPLTLPAEKFTVSPITAYADESYNEGGLTFTLYDDHAEVSGSDYKATSAEIPETVKGLPVTSIGIYAFNGSAIESVKIPDSVTYIGQWSFAMCDSLKEVTIPANIEMIDIKAFELCTSLKTVNLPDKFFKVATGAFWSTPWLKAEQEKDPLVIKNDVLIDGTACKGDVVIPSNVKYISSGAFEKNSNITSVVVPSSVKAINDSTFFYCDNLVSATLPNVETIDMMAFDGCTKLSEVKLSGKLKSIASYAFDDISASGTITFYGSKETWDKVEKPADCEYLNKAKYIFDENAQPPEDEDVTGDVNMDGEFNVSDLVVFQKWLLAVPNTELKNWKAADMCSDNYLDVIDLCAMRKELTKKL